MLHEVLAVEAGLKNTMAESIKEARDTFGKRREHFNGHNRKYTPLNEDGLAFDDENKEVVTTVADKLDFVQENIVRALDCLYQKELANTKACADIIVDGVKLAENVPATFLLNLESRFKDVRDMYAAIPTLEPGRPWKEDETQDNTYTADGGTKYKTEKVQDVIVKYPATDKHPAQTEMVSLDKNIGSWKTTYFSGALTPLEKSKLLAKIDTLLRAIKQARMRANEQKVDDKAQLGALLFDFIND